MTSHARTSSAILAFVLLSACGAENEPGRNNSSSSSMSSVMVQERTLQQVILELEAEGYDVSTGQEMTEPMFNVSGTQLFINGETVQLFEFSTDETASLALADISADGSMIGGGEVAWQGNPHFYGDGRMVALYIGSNTDVLTALEGAFGMQVAGSAMSEPTTGTGAMIEE